MRRVFATCLVLVCVWGADSDASNAVWSAEFHGRPHSVLPVERCFVPNVKICGGLPDEPLLEALMTAIHHDAVGKRSVNGRLVYTRMAIEGAALEKRAEWMKGEPLTEQAWLTHDKRLRRKALQRIVASKAGLVGNDR
jgi:hypothetical protein